MNFSEDKAGQFAAAMAFENAKDGYIALNRAEDGCFYMVQKGQKAPGVIGITTTKSLREFADYLRECADRVDRGEFPI